MNSAAVQKPKLLSLAWPIFVEEGLRVLIATVDTFMVSHLGDDAVAGLGVASQFIILFIIIYAFVGIGSSVVLTHHLGAHDRKGADRIASTAIAVNTWLGLGTSILVCALAAPMLHLMHLPPGPYHFALPFLSFMGGSLFLEAMSISISAILRAHTHTRAAMLVAVGQNVLNVVGNCLLLFGWFGFPRLGVVGVAISSVISRILTCAALWVLLEYYTRIKLRLRDFFQIESKRLRAILHIGLPAAGENICWWLAFMVVTAMIATTGGDRLATQSYVMQIIRWVILFSYAIGMGTEIIIGHLIGSGDYEHAYRELLRNLRLGFVCAITGSIALAFLAPHFLAFFTHDPVVIAVGVVLIRFGLILEPGRVFNLVVINALRATGDARFPVLMGMASMWGVWVPLSWLLGIKLGFGLPGFWAAMVCDEWLRGVMMYRRWKHKRWLPYAESVRSRLADQKAADQALAAVPSDP